MIIRRVPAYRKKVILRRLRGDLKLYKQLGVNITPVAALKLILDDMKIIVVTNEVAAKVRG